MTPRKDQDGRPDVLVVVGDGTGGPGAVSHLLREVARVRTATTLAQALRSCGIHPPDCVVLDLALPDAVGVAGLAAVTRAHPEVPVLALSGAGDAELVVEALEAGAQEYVHKDDADLRLAHAVRAAVDRAQGGGLRPEPSGSRGPQVGAGAEPAGGEPADGEREPVPQLRDRLLDAVGHALIAADASGRILYWNPAASELCGWSQAEAEGRSVTELLADSQPAGGTDAGLLAAIREGAPWSGETTLARRDGSTFTGLVMTRPLPGDAGPAGVVISVSAVSTEPVDAGLVTRRLAAVVASTGDSVILTSPDGIIEFWNQAAEAVHGWSAHEALGRHVSMLAPPGRQEPVETELERLQAGLTLCELEVTRLRRDGSSLEMSLTVSPVTDSTGRLVGVSTIGRDITERRAWQRALEHAALHDDLTGLPNRTLLSDRLEQLASTAEREPTPLGVLFVDLDGFKDINDAGGHLLGDQVLVEVAARIRDALSPGDTVARFGGDEFVVLLPGSTESSAGEVAERLLVALRRPLELVGQRLHVSASIGVAVSPPVAPGDLLRAADAAAYDAKAKGRSQFRTFAGELGQQAQERLTTSRELSEALGSDALNLVYQPVMDLGSGTVLGVEALVRWKHADLKEIPRSTFVNLAEKTGLARQLDAWVLRRSCAQFSALRAAGALPVGVYLAVNITAGNVLDPGFPAVVRAALSASGLPPELLVLEISEVGVMNDLDASVRMLGSLRELGIRIAIDDFGAGWSSLIHVKRLPASILKLDQSFVARVQEDRDDVAIAASVIDLGRATGMTVVAEGVETHGQLAVLSRLGCGAGQGHLWHEPVPADALATALSRAASVATSSRATRQQRASVDRLIQQPSTLAAEHGIERLWALHREGASMTTIAAALNRENYRTPAGQRWHSKSVAAAIGQAVLASHRAEP